MSFVTIFFGTDGLPVINLAGACEGSYFEDSELLDCPSLAYVMFFIRYNTNI